MELEAEVDAAVESGDEKRLRAAYDEARDLGGPEAWRLGARCLLALGVDLRKLVWATLMVGDVEVNVIAHLLLGEAVDGEEGWRAMVGRSVDVYVARGWLVRAVSGELDLGPGLPAIPPLPDCLACQDDGECPACEGGGTRLEAGAFGPCSDCEGLGTCAACRDLD